MKRTIIPGARTGRVRIPASKSQAHRLLICAALGEEKTEVVCDGISADIAATAKCLSALGAKIEEMETGFLVSPIKKVPEGRCDLYCGESGSTLRFLLPLVGALGADAVMICRPFLISYYGGGTEGIVTYVEKLRAELTDAMYMCGARCLSDITRDMVRELR